jgi:hypothetical protein
MLIKYANIESCQDHEKYVSVTFDEMHIRADLVYEKNSGELVGFIDVGDINNYLLAFQKSLEDAQPRLAKTMLVFMVRRLFGSTLNFPYAQFATKDLCGDQIFDPFWDTVYHLERCGLKVIASTADGAAPNRTFFSIHLPSKSSNPTDYKTKNPFANDRFIYFFSDPPHLLKTIRNCIANNKRQLWVKIQLCMYAVIHLYTHMCSVKGRKSHGGM